MIAPIAVPKHVEMDRHPGGALAPRTAAVLRALVPVADKRGRAAMPRDELAAATGLDALDYEIGIAVAQGRGVIERSLWRELPDGTAVLVVRFAQTESAG